jgi:energy-converting hydrogenase Eha subunit F
MKKIFAVLIAMVFVLTFAVVGCKKAEEPAPAEAPKVEAPVAQPAPAGTAVPAPAPEPAK